MAVISSEVKQNIEEVPSDLTDEGAEVAGYLRNSTG